MTTVIRPPVASDVETIARLHVSTWRETYSELVPESFFSDEVLERRRRMWTQVVESPDAGSVARVAVIAGEIVGMAMAGTAQADSRASEPPPTDLELHLIYVAKSAHGSGAGQLLLDAVLGDAPASLWVARDNPRARAFYARNRFVADGREFVDPRTERLVEIRLVRAASP